MRFEYIDLPAIFLTQKMSKVPFPSSSSIIPVVSSSIAIFSIITSYRSYHRVKQKLRQLENEVSKISEQRMSERKGRIRAEVKLRTVLKNNLSQEPNDHDSLVEDETNDSSVESKSNKPFYLKCIGTVVSPFTKRMGTPRQGALAPHARGYIQINTVNTCMETLDGIELYSHAWIIFQFHANTDIQTTNTKIDASNPKATITAKSKVRPPRAGGLKLGQMATRSPHRPNPIGLSLVKITGVDKNKKRLHIAALDLVNGTPVYDIKPVVPWDIPGYYDGIHLSVPEWVGQDDALANVTFTEQSERKLEQLVRNNKLAPLYTMTTMLETNENQQTSTSTSSQTDQFHVDGFMNAKLAIQEILAQDPRAAKKRGTVDGSSNVDPYKVIFGMIQVEFIILDKMNVNVVDVSLLNLDGVTYVDGIPFSAEGTMQD